MMINYEKFKQALAEQKEMSFIDLKKDIDNIKMIIERTLKDSFESTSSIVERDFKVHSL